MKKQICNRMYGRLPVIKKAVLSTALIIMNLQIFAQESLQKEFILKATVVTKQRQELKGFIANISDSAITLSQRPVSFRNTFNAQPTESTIDYSGISKVTARRKGSIRRGAWMGAATGAVLGAVSGLLSGDDPPDEWFALTAGQKAFALGIFTGGTGTIIGVIIGALSKKTFLIKGRKEAFNNMRASLYNQALTKQKKELSAY